MKLAVRTASAWVFAVCTFAMLLFSAGCVSYTGMSIITPEVPPAVQGSAYKAALQARGGVSPYHWSVKSGVLPPGISLNPITGNLSGTAKLAGDFTFTTEVMDSSPETPNSASMPMNLSVNSSSLQITTVSLPTAQTGTNFQTTLAAAGGKAPYRWQVSSGALPAGVSLNSTSGVLSGIPTQSGQFAISIQVSDSMLPSAESTVKPLTLPVILSLQITSVAIPKGQVGAPFKSVESGSGGVSPYIWSTMGTLPSGLTLDASSGAIAGTPTKPGVTSFTLVLTDSAGNSVQRSSTIEIDSATPPLSIVTTSLAQATAGQFYTANVGATGGTPPYAWSVSSGQLPIGLTMSSSGNVTGTPTAGGQTGVNVTVTDSSSPVQTTSKSLSVMVVNNPTVALDNFGGDSNHACAGVLGTGTPISGPTGYFYLYKDTTAKHWFFCDPAGNRFWMLSVQAVTGMTQSFYNIVGAKYGSVTGGWTAQEATRLKSMGFNTIGEYANLYMWPLPTYGHAGNTNPTPFIYTVTPGIDYYKYGIKEVVYNLPPAYGEYRGETFPDVFDPLWTSTDLPAYFSDAGVANPFQGSGGYKAADASPYIVGTTLDDSDALWGFKGFQGAYPHLAWMTWMMPPYMSSYADPTVHMKQQFAAYLQAKYGTIGALNQAWGSSYTSFGSSGVTVTSEFVAVGTGSQATFSKTLANTPVDPESVSVLIDGVPSIGDCPWFNQWSYNHGCSNGGTGTGILGGIAGSTITYASGVMTVTFAQAPANGAHISVTYRYGGWPKSSSGGTGLLDEDGTSSWFIPDPPDPAPGTIGADLDGFLGQIAEQYFSTVVGQLRTKLPHHLVFGPNPLGPKTRAPILAQAAKYLDGVMMEMEPQDNTSTLPFDHRPSGIAAYNTYGLPSFVYEIKSADQDSPYPNTACTLPDDCFSTQQNRGASYKNDLASYFNTYVGADGYGFVVGADYWQFTDNSSESANFGLITLNDNLYDGIQSCGASVVDAAGFTTTPESTTRCFGDFITSVKAGNSVWLGQ
jgi:hypothetical protein